MKMQCPLLKSYYAFQNSDCTALNQSRARGPFCRACAPLKLALETVTPSELGVGVILEAFRAEVITTVAKARKREVA
jgi:hypothetical protein